MCIVVEIVVMHTGASRMLTTLHFMNYIIKIIATVIL
jgi:hypothetical protein